MADSGLAEKVLITESAETIRPSPVFTDPYERSVKYMESHNIHQIFLDTTEKLVFDRPDDPPQFMLEQKMTTGQNNKKDAVFRPRIMQTWRGLRAKFGGRSAMIWGFFSKAGIGQIRLCEGCMNQAVYKVQMKIKIRDEPSNTFKIARIPK